MKKAPTKEVLPQMDQSGKAFRKSDRQGKVRIYWTLGCYDAVATIEAPTEKDAMKVLLTLQELCHRNDGARRTRWRGSERERSWSRAAANRIPERLENLINKKKLVIDRRGRA